MNTYYKKLKPIINVFKYKKKKWKNSETAQCHWRATGFVSGLK